MINPMKMLCAAAVSGVALFVVTLPAQALTAQECSAKYQAAKTAGTLNGQLEHARDMRHGHRNAAVRVNECSQVVDMTLVIRLETSHGFLIVGILERTQRERVGRRGVVIQLQEIVQLRNQRGFGPGVEIQFVHGRLPPRE